MFLDGEKDDWTKVGNKKSYAANAVGALHIIDDSPPRSRNVVVVVAESDERGSGGSIFEVVKFCEEGLVTRHMICSTRVRAGISLGG